MKLFNLSLIIFLLISITACKEEDNEEPTRTYWKKQISNLFDISGSNLYYIYNNALVIQDHNEIGEQYNSHEINYKNDLISFVIKDDLLLSNDLRQNTYVTNISASLITTKTRKIIIDSKDGYTVHNNFLYTMTSAERVGSGLLKISEFSESLIPIVQETIHMNKISSMASDEDVLFLCRYELDKERINLDSNSASAPDPSSESSSESSSEHIGISSSDVDGSIEDTITKEKKWERAFEITGKTSQNYTEEAMLLVNSLDGHEPGESKQIDFLYKYGVEDAKKKLDEHDGNLYETAKALGITADDRVSGRGEKLGGDALNPVQQRVAGFIIAGILVGLLVMIMLYFVLDMCLHEFPQWVNKVLSLSAGICTGIIVYSLGSSYECSKCDCPRLSKK